MGSPRRRRDADDGVGVGGRAGVSAVSPLDPSGLSSALGFTSLFNPTWDASCPCCSPSPRAPGRGCRGRLFSRGGRSWRIRPSYKIFVPSFAPVRNNLRLSEAKPHVDVDADRAGTAVVAMCWSRALHACFMGEG